MNFKSKLLLWLGVRWVKTLRVKTPTLPTSGILVLWHEHMLLCLPAFANCNMRVLISQSRDGEWGAHTAARLGYVPVRGSSSRGGASALRSLANDLSNNGGWVAIVADGPRGPRRIAKPGAEWLSQQTGLPIVHVTAECQFSFRLKSWDRCMVPLPFTTVGVTLTPNPKLRL